MLRRGKVDVAVITRIEFVNFLSEGWQPHMGVAGWRPLWPANTIRLAGQSTAIQIDNGCGKTSATNAVLYLMSRDKRLRTAFLERCAPVGAGYTHVRIEFGIRSDEASLQSDLITTDPVEFPGETYVIGVCANRGDEDSLQFYRYPGFLEDAVAYSQGDGKIVFVNNEAFRASVKRLPKGEWNRWATLAEWRKVVSDLISPEVVKQNVAFHLKGGGDASAALKDIKVRSGERFDEAYFRQVIAPQLLGEAMGESALDDERTIEDTITISMNRFIDAKLKVETKDAHLKQREEAERNLQPVVEAANAIHAVRSAYLELLQELSRDAAYLDRFADGAGKPFPGVPKEPGQAVGASAMSRKCLNGMAVDIDGTLVISDSTLADVLGQTTGNLNQLADRSSADRASVLTSPVTSQAIDFACNIKREEGRGGRRKATRHYSKDAALELAARRPGDSPTQAADAIDEAFTLASTVLDTNQFRHEVRRLTNRRNVAAAAATEKAQLGQQADERRLTLESHVKERAENQAAYQEFCQNAPLLPATLQGKPAEASTWFGEELARREDAVSAHARRVGELTPSWNLRQELVDKHGLQPLADRLAEVRAEMEAIDAAFTTASNARDTAERLRDEQRPLTQTAKDKHDTFRREHEALAPLAQADAQFRSIFGDIDLATAPAPEPLREKKQLEEKLARHAPLFQGQQGKLAEFSRLKPAVAAYRSIFADADPMTVNPQAAVAALGEQLKAAEMSYAQHQPYAEAAEQFAAQSADLAPRQWIEKVDTLRADAEQLARQAQVAKRRLQAELATLEREAVVDDAAYLDALSVLNAAHVPFTRVREEALAATQDKSRALSLLSAMSSVLSAPVVENATVAEAAIAALSNGGLHVPVFLRSDLQQFLKTAEAQDTKSGAVAGFVAGPRTRRVRALLDPEALEQEKAQLRQDIDREDARERSALADVLTHATQSDAYRLALKAKEAAHQNSQVKARAAQADTDRLQPLLLAAKSLVTEDALASLRDTRLYLRLGGDAALGSVEADIARMTAERDALNASLSALEPKTTREALLCIESAVKFHRGGGASRLKFVQDEEPRLEAASAAAAKELGAREAAFLKAKGDFSGIETQHRKMQATHPAEARQLDTAVEFEKSPDFPYMQGRAGEEKRLTDLREMLRPLGRVNFVRAQSYVDNQDQIDAELQESIASAIRERDQLARESQVLHKEGERLAGELMVADKNARALHELAYFLGTRRLSVSPYLEDLDEREGGGARPEAHELFARTDALANRINDWRPAEGSFDPLLIQSVRSEVEMIDVSSKGTEVGQAKRRVGSARERFQSARDGFCRTARGQANPALSEAEIEAVETAATIEQLHSLVQLGSRLRADLGRERDELQELQKAAAENEQAILDGLARFVSQARANLDIMNKTLGRNPNAKFEIETTVIDDDEIRRLLLELRDHIEASKREAASRARISRLDREDTNVKALVRDVLAVRIFKEPKVKFRHVGIWNGDTRLLTDGLSEGQKAALQMMWLIKESEYVLDRTIRAHLGNGSRKKLLNRSQRILFFDGLFSNLSDRRLIDEAFKGLSNAGANLQLIGLIHNPEYRNNYEIFPTLVVGKKAGWNGSQSEREYVQFEDGRTDGSVGLATFMMKKPDDTVR